MTTFVEMYHPLLAGTYANPKRVAGQAVDNMAALGWLPLGGGAVPDPETPYYTKAALLSQITGRVAPIGTAVGAASVTAVEAAATVAPTGQWNFATPPKVAGKPFGLNLPINVKSHGAVGDTRRVADASISAGQMNMSSATASFTAADVGKTVIFFLAGAAGAALITTIASVQSPTSATLATAAASNVASAGTAYIGTDDTAAILAALASGRGVYLPTGFYICRQNLTLAAESALRGEHGSAFLMITGSVRLSRRCTVDGITFVAPGTSNSTAITNVNATAENDVKIRNNRFEGWAINVNVDRTADNTQTEGWTISDNVSLNGTVAGFYIVRLFKSLITRNKMVSAATSYQHILFTAGSRNRVTENELDFGKTGITWVYRRDLNGAFGTSFRNVISGNTIVNISEEGISFDVNGSTAATVAVVDRGTVASKANPSGAIYNVVVSGGTWATETRDYTGYYACFLSGALKGQPVKITGHLGATLTLALAASQYAILTAADQFTVGMPFIGNVISGNTVDTSARGVARGLHLYGLCYQNTVVGNTVIGTGAAKGGLQVDSITGLAQPANLSASSGLAPSEGNTVVGNTVNGDDLSIALHSYGGSYTSSRNVVTGNTIVNGRLRWDNQVDTTGIGTNSFDSQVVTP